MINLIATALVDLVMYLILAFIMLAVGVLIGISPFVIWLYVVWRKNSSHE